MRLDYLAHGCMHSTNLTMFSAMSIHSTGDSLEQVVYTGIP